MLRLTTPILLIVVDIGTFRKARQSQGWTGTTTAAGAKQFQAAAQLDPTAVLKNPPKTRHVHCQRALLAARLPWGGGGCAGPAAGVCRQPRAPSAAAAGAAEAAGGGLMGRSAGAAGAAGSKRM